MSSLKNLAYCVLLLSLSACGKKDGASVNDDDTSVSGSVVGVVGSALSDTSASGSVAFYENPNLLKSLLFEGIRQVVPYAQASTAAICPRPASASSSVCSASAGNMWLTFDHCSRGNSSATLNGIVLFSMSTGSANCGHFPSVADGTLLRQFVTANNSTTPGSMTRTWANGRVVTFDHATANLNNFASDTISTLGNGGYGASVTFSGGARTALKIAQRRYVSNGFDHSIVGNLTLSSDTATSRTVSGTMTVYHNLEKVIGTATLTNVVHTNTCCTPTSGSVSTTFSAHSGYTPSAHGALLVGKTETLTITGCGTGTLTLADGSSSSIALNCF